jgi:hypothetical protein
VLPSGFDAFSGHLPFFRQIQKQFVEYTQFVLISDPKIEELIEFPGLAANI